MSMFDYMKTPEATYNPYAPAEPAPKKARSGFKVLRLLFEAVLILIIVVLLAAGGDSDSTAAGNGRDTVTAESLEEQEPAVDPAFPGALENDLVGQPGDALMLDALTVTASPLRDGDTSFGEKPSLCTTTTLHSSSDETVSFDSFDWDLQWPSGVISYSVHWGSDNMLTGAGKIAPGGSISGDVCFANTPAETGEHILLYTPDLPLDYEDPTPGRGAWINER